VHVNPPDAVESGLGRHPSFSITPAIQYEGSRESPLRGPFEAMRWLQLGLEPRNIAVLSQGGKRKEALALSSKTNQEDSPDRRKASLCLGAGGADRQLSKMDFPTIDRPAGFARKKDLLSSDMKHLRTFHLASKRHNLHTHLALPSVMAPIRRTPWILFK
jgi:hypothetical protein